MRTRPEPLGCRYKYLAGMLYDGGFRAATSRARHSSSASFSRRSFIPPTKELKESREMLRVRGSSSEERMRDVRDTDETEPVEPERRRSLVSLPSLGGGGGGPRLSGH